MGAMEKELVLGIDCGTQSLRATLYRVDGTLLAQASASFPTAYPHPNWAEQDPEDWWRALTQAVPACIRNGGVPASDIAALGIDSTSFTGVWCDEHGVPLRPAVLWMDHRAAKEAHEIVASRHPVLEHSGWRVSPEWMLPKAMWIAGHEPDTHKRARRIAGAVDWLVHRLTGIWTTSTGGATSKRHWTPGDGWPRDLYAQMGVPDLAEKNPDSVQYNGDPTGTLLPEAAASLGLSPDCIVAHAGMDGWVAPIGKACIEPGTASLTLGTSTVMILETATPTVVDGIMGPFPEGIRRNRFTYEAGQTSGASAVSWTLGLMGVEPDTQPYARIEREAMAIPAGSDGIVVFDAWRGNRTPYFDAAARGVVFGLTLDHTPAHVYRAVLEGCAFGIRNVLARLTEAGHAIHEFRVCGSGANNGLWTRLIADITRIPLRVSAEKHATCLGSAVCAAAAAGCFASLEEAAAAMVPAFETVTPHEGIHTYDEYFAAYLEIYAKTRDIMAHLSALTEHKPPEKAGNSS